MLSRAPQTQNRPSPAAAKPAATGVTDHPCKIRARVRLATACAKSRSRVEEGCRKVTDAEGQGSRKETDVKGQKFVEQLKKLPDDALATLYTAHSERFVSDNNRIWSTASTMIPLSLGAFVVLANIKEPTFAQVMTCSLSGWLLITFWLVTAENHRAFQEASLKWLDAIESAWGLTEQSPGKVPKNRGVTSRLTGEGMTRRARWGIWWAVTIGSIIVVTFWPSGVLTYLS